MTTAPVGVPPLLDTATASLSSLGLFVGKVGALVGRSRELTVIDQALADSRTRMAGLVIEGEPGIGKTRLLLALQERARVLGHTSIAVTNDEELKGPFLLARSILTAPGLLEAAEGSAAATAVRRAFDVLSNGTEEGLENLAPDRKLVRVFDLASNALSALATVRPLTLIVDDLQWADEDSLRMLRYVVRTGGASPICLVFAMRPEESAFVQEAVTLLADMDRVGVLRRIRLARFSQLESMELLQQLLGGRIDLASAGVMHAQAEGVPFILAEQAGAYRDAGLIQQIDGVWTLARNADRLIPSAVKTMIQRRSAHLPEGTQALIAEAACLGRHFSLRDLAEVRRHLEPAAGTPEAHDLAELLAPAVASGLLTEHADGAAADYSFTHERVREYEATTLPVPRRRAIHGAIVDMLTSGGDPAPASLPMLARHALAAGRGELAARVAVDGARAALQASAPEEALRLVDIAQPVAAGPKQRVELLRLRDDALGVLRRAHQRLEVLTELGALAEALGDNHLELEVMLRRAAALRLSEERDDAAEIARRVRERAAEMGDAPAELAACIELGQDLLGLELGDGYSQTATDGDFDGAQEAYERALALAVAAKDEASEAAVSRELGVIQSSRIRDWFVSGPPGSREYVIKELLSGIPVDEIEALAPARPWDIAAKAYFSRALEIYEQRGDRQGVMMTIVPMAALAWAREIHLAGSIRHIEEIRRLTSRVKSLTRESERARLDAQMLFGTFVYARAKGFYDVALTRGAEAYSATRALGDRSLEFAIAGAMAMQQAEIGAFDEAKRWLDRAASVATAEPTPLRALQLAGWRGGVAAAASEPVGMREQLEHAAELAATQGRPSARCEALSFFAIEAACLGEAAHDDALLTVSARAAEEAKALAATLPGHILWGAQADAALARVAIGRGDFPAAAEAGRRALQTIDSARREDLNLLIVAHASAGVIAGGSPEEAAAARDRLQLLLGLLVQRIADEDIRTRWFSGPFGRELVDLAGVPALPTPVGEPGEDELDARQRELLRLLVEGRTNREIADELSTSEEAVGTRLASLFARIGVVSRSDAMSAALLRNLV